MSLFFFMDVAICYSVHNAEILLIFRQDEYYRKVPKISDT